MINKKRGPGRIKAHYNSDALYDHYVKRRAGKNVVSKKLYTKVLREFNRELIKLMAYHSYEVSLPGRLGHMRVKKYKPRIKVKEDGSIDMSLYSIDYKATMDKWERDPAAREAKKIVYHMNEHTDGYVFKWFWDKSTCDVKNQSAYKFFATRYNKRLLTQINRDDSFNVDYLE